jgi:peptidoglycan/xylan/chitin deacetylase (PgdA/CDA1 family)
LGRRLAKLTCAIERRLWPSSPVILIYHRVADLERDPWGLAVSPALFAEQVEALKGVRRIVPLGELIAAAREGSAGPWAAITFDDGYHDAFTVARPILHRLDAPATVYVATGPIGTDREFWWDELAAILLEAPALPERLVLEIAGRRRAWAVDGASRERVCRQVRRVLRDLAPAEIEEQLDELRRWAGLARSARPSHRAVTGEEAAALSDGLVGVGAHTIAHPSLPRLSPAAQAREIGESRRVLQEITGAPVEHFAYPFGHYDGSSLKAAAEAGFASACATTAGVVRPWTDPYALPRISPGRRSGEELARLLA